MRIHNHLHEYDFPYHDYLLRNINYIDKKYNEGITEALSNNGVNVRLPNDEIWNFLNPKLNKIIQDNYYVSPLFSNHSFGVYKQVSEQNNVYDSHNHINSASITGVFYINPPKPGEGGELVLHIDNVYDNVFYLQPKPNKLYLFPSWVYHHITPQSTSTPRYSINWGYESRLRPIHKITGDRW